MLPTYSLVCSEAASRIEPSQSVWGGRVIGVPLWDQYRPLQACKENMHSNFHTFFYQPVKKERGGNPWAICVWMEQTTQDLVST
jgi:hypothetical protein